MKKMLCLCAVLVLMLCCLPRARADVIFEPMDDFYSEHREECVYHDRSYIANGPNGDVKAYKSPESDKIMQTLENGTLVYIAYIYQDETGTQWGYNGNWDEEGGWIPMPYLELVYDHISFEEEYGSSFVQEEGSLDTSWRGKEVWFWNYPGSKSAMQMRMGEENMPQYDMVYTDENGIRWGRGMYYFGMRDYWMCLDEPDSDLGLLYSVETETGETIASPAEKPTAPVEEIKPGKSIDSSTIVIGVLAVVAVSFLLLNKMKYRS